MKFSLDEPQEQKKAFAYLTLLATRHAAVEVRRLSPRRTLTQNRYLHLIIAAFGNFFGYTPEEAKMVYKYINNEIYRYKRRGITFYRSSADLTKDEMAVTIDKFMGVSAKNGYELPKAEDHKWIWQLENELEKSRYFAEGAL